MECSKNHGVATLQMVARRRSNRFVIRLPYLSYVASYKLLDLTDLSKEVRFEKYV